jgi:hypothetical protein
MTRQTKAQQEKTTEQQQRIEVLEREVQLLQRPIALTLTYTRQGQLLVVATSDVSSSETLRATKAALSQLLNQVDALLLAAVEREAIAAARRIEKDERDGAGGGAGAVADVA